MPLPGFRSNELNFSDVYGGVNYIGSLAKFT